MKLIPKATLDELIRLTRKYYETGDAYILPVRIEVAHKLSKDALGDRSKWISFSDVICSIISGNGLKPQATNEDIYQIFELLGYSIQQDEETTNEPH